MVRTYIIPRKVDDVTIQSAHQRSGSRAPGKLLHHNLTAFGKFNKMNEAKELYPSFIAISVLNAFLSYSAIMLNIVTIHAVRKTSSLPKPLKTLLLSLALSDLGVGLMAQPLYIAWLVKLLQNNTESSSTYTMEIAFLVVIGIFVLVSFLGVVAISVDRFLAIHLHLRYQELVTHKRVVAVTISIWVFSAFFSLISLWISRDVIDIACIFIFGLFITGITVIYFRIYFVVKRHTNQIQALQIQQEAQSDEMTNFARLRKSAVSTFYVYLVFVICYLPGYCRVIIITIVSEQNTTSVGFILYMCSWSLILLNSSLNPIIYGWKMRHIRHAIMDILRNAFARHN